MFDNRSTAILSDCGRYRYTLTREWMGTGPGQVLSETRALFVMLNPSTADADQDDPTIRKCMGFAKRWGRGGMTVVNLYAYRATKPADLWASYGGILGLFNMRHIDEALKNRLHTQVVAAWGASIRTPAARDRGPAHATQVLDRIARAGHTPQCLGKTQAGDPRHPLMLPYATPLVPVR